MMNRLGRYALRSVLAISIVVFAAAVALWVRSGLRLDERQYTWHGHAWRVVSGDGRIVFDNEPQRRLERQSYKAAVDAFFANRAERAARLDAVIARYGRAEYGTPGWQPVGEETSRFIREVAYRKHPTLALTAPAAVTIRHATLVGGTLAFPGVYAGAILAAHFVRRRREARRGLCAKCGYDLRASPQRCPECGTPASRQAVAVPPPPRSFGLERLEIRQQ